MTLLIMQSSPVTCNFLLLRYNILFSVSFSNGFSLLSVSATDEVSHPYRTLSF